MIKDVLLELQSYKENRNAYTPEERVVLRKALKKSLVMIGSELVNMIDRINEE